MAYELNWQFDINRAVLDNSTVAKLSASITWQMIQFLRGTIGGATLAPWTLIQCSNGAAVDLVGNDLLSNPVGPPPTFDSTKWVRATAGVAHSWAVLRSPANFGGTGVYVYMVIDYSGNTAQAPINLHYSYTVPGAAGGGSDGTIQNRPTCGPGDAAIWSHTANLQVNDNTATAHKLHMILAETGDFVLLTSKNGTSHYYLGIVCTKLADTYSIETAPVITYAKYNASSPFTAASIGASQVWLGRAYDNSVAVLGTILMPYSAGTYSLDNLTIAGDTVASLVSPAKTRFIDFPMYYWVQTPAGNISMRGRIRDLKLASNALGEGVVEPTVPASPTSVVVGSVWVPTNALPSL